MPSENQKQTPRPQMPRPKLEEPGFFSRLFGTKPQAGMQAPRPKAKGASVGASVEGENTATDGTPEGDLEAVPASAEFQAAYARDEARKEYDPDAFGIMEGIDLKKLFGGLMGMGTSGFLDPGSIQFGQWLWNRRDEVLRFHKTVFTGSPYEDGEKMATIAGGLQLINKAVKEKGINDEMVGMLVHELVLGATGHILGRDSLWKRMIPAAWLTLDKTVDHTAEEVHAVANIKNMVETGQAGVRKLAEPGEAQAQVAALIQKYLPNIEVPSWVGKPTREAAPGPLRDAGYVTHPQDFMATTVPTHAPHTPAAPGHETKPENKKQNRG